MNWQPPPPPPRPGGHGPAPGGPGGQRPGGQPPYGQPGGQPGGQPQHQQQQQQQQQQQGPAEKDWKDMNYYQLLQVNREAHQTIIRYAYRFLAAMYHPDNTETGDAEKFRIITEAWRTLSDDGKRAAYDMSLGAEEELQPRHPGAGGGPRPAGGGFKRENMPKIRPGVSFNEIELRLAILSILLEQRRKKPKSGGASAKMIMDVLDIRDIEEIEFSLWYMREKGLLEMGERSFMITSKGVDYVVESLAKTTVLQESETEKKMRKIVEGGVPAVIPH